MPFFYITGVAGSGKSAVQQGLQRHGFHVVDEDDPEIGSAHNKATDQPVKIPAVEERSADWFDHHEWRVFDAALDALHERSKREVVVICGVSLSEEMVEQRIDKVFYLRLDESTLRHRLETRDDNDFGKSAKELAMILERKQIMDRRFKASAVNVDATQNLEDVVSAIIASTV